MLLESQNQILFAGREIAKETARRRTFAIISHPDAGKTTLTEKLLLYAGAVDVAGSVRPKKSDSYATSDWMALEQARGISITSTALQFEYGGCLFNLLDTPGHQDFSEDTYRTLTAVDSAVMVLDSAKGIEPQTRKLFDVCRMRKVPILTFINKMDQPGRDPLELLDEIEKQLGIPAVPLNWPIGSGPVFQGIYDLEKNSLLRFQRSFGGSQIARSWEVDLDDASLIGIIGEDEYRHLQESLDLLKIAGAAFDRDHFLNGDLTPVFFGSALNNFGVENFLDALVAIAPPPQPRSTREGSIDPSSNQFSAFVFKIQTNMDPQHRDSMAFLRICSGRFQRDMYVHHARLKRTVRMTRAHRLFARDRAGIDEAFPGDVVGVVNPGHLAIGDTLSSDHPVEFPPLPSFQPENFAVLRLRDISRSKQFRKGVDQLAEEGVVQVFYAPDNTRREPIVGAVGRLQFDVVVSRLEQEYRVQASMEPLPYVCARWVEGEPEDLRQVRWPTQGIAFVRDRLERQVCLFTSLWEVGYLTREYPKVRLSETG